jgi:hypothetical protein
MIALSQFGRRRFEFQRIADQLIAANTHFYYAEKLDEAGKSDLRNEFYKSKDFWHLTISAHIQIAVVHLCRVFDQQKDDKRGRTFHLLRFVENIDEAKLTNSQRKKRQADLQFLQREEPEQKKSPNAKVAKLRKCRAKLVAHLDYDWAINCVDEARNLIEVAEIESLIDEGFSILERWAFYYEVKNEIQRLLSGKDDYLFVLKSLRNGKQSHSQNLNPCSSVSICG